MIIYKYEVVPGTLQLPIGATILHLGDQYDHMYIWVMFDESQHETEPRTFHMVGAGHAFPENSRYIGTAQQSMLVWHLFEEIQEENPQ